MPTYIKKETVGQAASADRIPVSGKDESGLAQALPVLSTSDATVDDTQPVVPIREVDEYTKYTRSLHDYFDVQVANPGGIDEAGLHPHLLDEHTEDASAILGALASGGNTDIGQTFRASGGLLEKIAFRMGVVGTGVGHWGDNFEGYASTPALRASWVTSNLTDTAPSLETSVFYSGTKALSVTVGDGNSLGDTVTTSLKRLTGLTSIVGTFVSGETVTGGTSGATGTVYGVGSDYLMLVPGSGTGTFSAAETVTGGTSGATATVGAYAASEDWSNLQTLRFWWRQTETQNRIIVWVRISDGTNTKYHNIPVGAENTWEEKVFYMADFIEEVGITDMTAIQSVEFEIIDDGRDGLFYVDQLDVEGDPGTVDVEIYQVASAAPTTFGTLMGTATFDLQNSANQKYRAEFGGLALTPAGVSSLTSITGTFTVGETATGGTSGATGVITEVGATYLYLVSITGTFSAAETVTGGTSGATATVGAVDVGYYAFSVTNPSSVVVILTLLGNNGDNNYANGSAFTSTDNGTTVTSQTLNDAAFEVWCRRPVLLVGLRYKARQDPKTSNIDVFIENKTTEKLSQILIMEAQLGDTSWQTVEVIPATIGTHEELEVQLQSDHQSTLDRIDVVAFMRHEPVLTHG